MNSLRCIFFSSFFFFFLSVWPSFLYFHKIKEYLYLVTRQQKQQHGNQLAKETDRLMKAFSALPIGPDQVLDWTEENSFPKQSFKAALSPRKMSPKGAIKEFVLYCKFLGFSLNVFFLCLFSGKGRYRKSVCWTTSPPLWTASRGSSGRRPTPRESLWPESERAPGCRWVTRRTGNTTGPVKQTAGGRYKASAGPSENLKMP